MFIANYTIHLFRGTYIKLRVVMTFSFLKRPFFLFPSGQSKRMLKYKCTRQISRVFFLAWSVCYGIGQGWETFRKVTLCTKNSLNCCLLQPTSWYYMKYVARHGDSCVRRGGWSNVLIYRSSGTTYWKITAFQNVWAPSRWDIIIATPCYTFTNGKKLFVRDKCYRWVRFRA